MNAPQPLPFSAFTEQSSEQRLRFITFRKPLIAQTVALGTNETRARYINTTYPARPIDLCRFRKRHDHTARHLSLQFSFQFRHNQRRRVRSFLQCVHRQPCIALADTRITMTKQHLNIIETSSTGNHKVSELMPITVNPHLANTGCLSQPIPAARNGSL
mgnify:CR=1 FL=1